MKFECGSIYHKFFSRSIEYIKYSAYLAKRIIFSFIILIRVVSLNQAYAEDTMNTIISVLSGLTCETQGVGNLLRSEFTHTCVPAAFSTISIANMVSPGMYVEAMSKLRINDDQLFPDACARENRIDPDNLILNFGLCNNVRFMIARAEAIPKAAVAIAAAFLTGSDPWESIKDAWIPPTSEYTDIHSEAPGAMGVQIDPLAPFPITPWQVVQDNDRLCMATLAITGWLPVGCVYIKEPYPKSIYSSFMDLDGSEDYASDTPVAMTFCNGSGGCYQRAYNASHTSVVITSPIIECIKQMIAQLLIDRSVCTIDSVGSFVKSSNTRTSSVLYTFQSNMYHIVSLLLTIYVILFGFKILLQGEPPPKKDLINFAIKMIFVSYFAVGINIEPYNNAGGRLDGMSQWAFPFLLNGMQEIAGWIINASPSELCRFGGGKDMYPEGLGYISLWDSLDCRVAHYLGLDMIQTMLVENQARNHDWAHFDFFNFSIPPYYYLLPPAIMSGSTTLISLVLMYPLLVISVGAYLVNATVVCMISIVILGVLAPIFVPMLLFEYTKGYFRGWMKLLLSFMLQPMVTVAFMVIMFSVYDFGFYGSCKYTHSYIDSNGRSAKIFYIDNNWDNGNYGPGEAEGCKNSLGYMLNNPLSALYNMGAASVEEATSETSKSSTNDSFMSKFSFLSAINTTQGLIFPVPQVVFQILEDLILALITACFTLYLMYHFSAQLSDFAADMTEGVSLKDVAIGAQDIFKAGMQAIGAAGGSPQGGGAGQSGASGIGDRAAVGEGGSEAEDVASALGGEAADLVNAEGAVSNAASSIGGNSSSSRSSISKSSVDKVYVPSASEIDTNLVKISSSATSQTTTKFGIEAADISINKSNINISVDSKDVSNAAIDVDLSNKEESGVPTIVQEKARSEKTSEVELPQGQEIMKKAFSKIGVDSKDVKNLEEYSANNLNSLRKDSSNLLATESYKKHMSTLLSDPKMRGKESEFMDVIESNCASDSKNIIRKIHGDILEELKKENRKDKL